MKAENTKNQTFEKHPVSSFFLLGISLTGFGILFIWLPFFGIAMVLIGLACVLLAIVFLILKIVVAIKGVRSK